MPSKKPDVILFDWDNTLADTWHIIHKSLEKTFILMGEQPLTFDQVMKGERGIHGSLRNSFPVIFGDRWQEAREHYYNSFLEVHLDEIKIMPGVEKTLETLLDKNIELCVVSNKTGDYLRDEVKYLGLEPYFKSIIGATDAKDDKPTHHPVELALKKTSVMYDRGNYNDAVWFVGDSITDLQTANNSNIVGFLYGNNADALIYHRENNGSDAKHAYDHKEFLGIVRSL